jgi:predicted transcriptional regulator
MFSLFARPKPCRIITLLKDTDNSWHLSKIAKNSDTTYVYVTKLISQMQKEGLVVIEVKGKKRMVRLTDRGIVIANLLQELMTRLDGPQ